MCGDDRPQRGQRAQGQGARVGDERQFSGDGAQGQPVSLADQPDVGWIVDSYLQELPARQRVDLQQQLVYGGSHDYTVASASWSAGAGRVAGKTGPQPLLAVFAAGNSGRPGGGLAGHAKNVIQRWGIKHLRYITNKWSRRGKPTSRGWA